MICAAIFFAYLFGAIILVEVVERIIKFVFAHDIWCEEKEERNERYEKYRAMFNEMKKG